MRILKQSTAVNIMVLMTNSTDHVAGETGLTLTITASKNGGAFASITPTVTERGSGWYNLAFTAAHTDTLGDLAVHITATGADPTDFACSVFAQTFDDLTAPDNAGIAAIKAKTDNLPASPANEVTLAATDIKVDELHRLQGAKLGEPMTVDTVGGTRSVGSIVLDLATPSDGVTIVTRQ